MSGGSESAAVMTSRESFTVTSTISPAPAQNSAASTQPPQLDQQQMRVSFPADGTYGTYRPMGSPPFQSITGGATAVAKQPMNMNNSSGGEQKRKRGRPRKYGPDGSMTMVVASAPQPISVSMPPQTQTFSPPSVVVPPPLPAAESHLAGSASPSVKRRGRPPGSSNKKKQMEAIGSTGIGFIPHVINVKAGEDVCSKVVAFSQNGPRTVCILSATGAVSNVTLRQSATCGGTATYEGRFDILSLSGSFMLSDVGGQKTRTGGLSTTLAGPDGRVFGGCVAGLLIAASPVQVIVGSFLADGRKEPKPINHMEPLSAPPQMNFGGGAGTSSSPSRGTFSESSGGPASPPNLSSGACNNNNHPQGMSGIPWK